MTLQARIIEDGPLSAAEVSRHITVKDRESGVRVFRLHAGRGSADFSTGSPGADCVYWHEDYHTAQEVLEAYFEANPIVLELCTPWSVYQKIALNCSPAFKEAAKELLGPFRAMQMSSDEARERSEPKMRFCPMCGDEATPNIPEHMRKECSAVEERDSDNSETA